MSAALLTQASTTRANIAPPLHLQQLCSYDIVIYGCTSAGVIAAVESRNQGKTVALICRDAHVGGMSANGLGYTDFGDVSTVGGLSRQFYQDIHNYYVSKSASLSRRSTEDSATNDGLATTFEPHVAELVFENLLKRAQIIPFKDSPLRRDGHSVRKVGAHLISLKLADGRVFPGKEFIDASYEGDLMAEAGVRFAIGREANKEYGETLNGVENSLAQHHQFVLPIDPYVVPGKPNSGLLPLISSDAVGTDGSGDSRIQAYTFRLCLTKNPSNRTPFPKPTGYDPKQYELLRRYLYAGWRDDFSKFSQIPYGKADLNNNGAFSTDDIGNNYRYPTGSDSDRSAVVAEHKSYQQGLLWFVQNDLGVPSDVRASIRPWGLCRDEFRDNDNWPYELYIREARRMIGAYVMTERDIRGPSFAPMSIGVGSYNIDSHNVRRFVDNQGHARNEGDVQINPGRAYSIGYSSIVPLASDADNLLVPVALSSSHIAYGSIRMEPVLMILGQSAAAAASLAIDESAPVQKVSYPALRQKLLADGQIIDPRPHWSLGSKKVRFTDILVMAVGTLFLITRNKIRSILRRRLTFIRHTR